MTQRQAACGRGCTNNSPSPRHHHAAARRSAGPLPRHGSSSGRCSAKKPPGVLGLLNIYMDLYVIYMELYGDLNMEVYGDLNMEVYGVLYGLIW